MREKTVKLKSDKLLGGALVLIIMLVVVGYFGFILIGVWGGAIFDIKPFWFTGLSNAIFSLGGAFLVVRTTVRLFRAYKKGDTDTSGREERHLGQLVAIGAIWAYCVTNVISGDSPIGWAYGGGYQISFLGQIGVDLVCVIIGLITEAFIWPLLLKPALAKRRTKLKAGVVRSGDAMAEVAAKNNITDALDQDY